MQLQLHQDPPSANPWATTVSDGKIRNRLLLLFGQKKNDKGMVGKGMVDKGMVTSTVE
jgi:hypothetical protein